MKSKRNPNIRIESVNEDYEKYGVVAFHQYVKGTLTKFALFPNGSSLPYEQFTKISENRLPK